MPSPGRRIRLGVGCGLALAAIAVPGALAQSQPARRVGFAPRLPLGTSLLGPVAGSARTQVAVALEPRDPAALEAFATEVSTPGSSIYRQYLTPSEFASRFGATSAQIAAVQASLRAHGLAPGPANPNGLSIPVSATTAQLERAFAVTLERIRLPSRTAATVNTAAPLLDANIAGLVQGVVGLNSLSAPRPLYVRPLSVHARATPHVVTGGPQPCAASRSAAPAQSAYTTDQIASAYGFSSLYHAGDTGAGQTIALYELESYDPTDIGAYQSCYGTHASVTPVPVNGGAGSGPGSGEAALDIEQAVGLAPGASFLVYEGPNSNASGPGSGYYDTWSAIVTPGPGTCDLGLLGSVRATRERQRRCRRGHSVREAAAQGQTITSATGDNGSEDCNGQTILPDTALAVDDPSSQPFITAVGGTTMSSLGPRPTEQVWNNGGNPLGNLLGIQSGAGGGGISSRWAMPGYQSNAPSWLHVTQSHARETPDVSADADPNTGYLIYYNGSGTAGGPAGWQGIGGTSAAAPVWAAAIALINASPACGGAMVGFANPALYKAAAAAYGQDFNDITRGNNDFTGTNGGRYTATPGFDMASGLGSPNAGALGASMCQHAARPVLQACPAHRVRRRPVAPTLRVTVRAGTDAPAVQSIRIRPPSGLRFVRNQGGVVVTGPGQGRVRFGESVSHGVLVIRLAPHGLEGDDHRPLRGHQSHAQGSGRRAPRKRRQGRAPRDGPGRARTSDAADFVGEAALADAGHQRFIGRRRRRIDRTLLGGCRGCAERTRLAGRAR